MAPKKQDPKTLFLKHIEIGNDCWEWIGSNDRKTGYGKFELSGKSGYAHRAAYELFVGPIPDGLCVMHECDNRICVNPKHLKLGTYKDNELDKRSKRRHARHELQGPFRLVWSQVIEIRKLYSVGSHVQPIGKRGFGTVSGYSQRRLAEMFGVAQSLIGRIVRNEIWKSEDRPGTDEMIKSRKRARNQPNG